eukprot:jgi/Mesen1/528/ME000104S10624
MDASVSQGGFPFRLLQPGPRTKELTGASDLVSHYGLKEQYEVLCKRALKPSIADTGYLNKVVGDTDIRRGEGMELKQLLDDSRLGINPGCERIEPLDLDFLRSAFTFRNSGAVSLPESERGQPTISGRVPEESKDTDKKHKKHKGKEREKRKDKDKKKEKQRDKRKEKGENGEDSHKKHKKKKRKREVDDDKDAGDRKHKRKHKHSSKGDVTKTPPPANGT